VGTGRGQAKDVGMMKGLLYSIMISLLLIPILGLVIFYSQSSQIRNIDIDIRANELEYFTKSIEKDLTRFLEINGKRAMISAVSNVIINGVGLDSAQLRLAEMIENGTLYGNVAPLIDTSNLGSWKVDVENIASKAGFNVEFENIQIYINQNDSFNVLFSANVTINISDKLETMGIEKVIISNALVSIENIEDPSFPLNTYSRVLRFIEKSNVSKDNSFLVQGLNSSGYVSGDSFVIDSSDLTIGYADKILVTDTVAGKEAIASVFKGIVSEGDIVIPAGLTGKAITGASGARNKIRNNTKIYLDQNTKKVWDLSNLTMDIANGYYQSSENGASFLDRLEGNIMLSPKYMYGIETFVYLPDLTDADLPVNTLASCIDYQYWQDVAGSGIRNGNYDTVYNWFKIDNNNAIIYGIGDLIT
jgi:hypothetical protein